jgi:gamma-glutamyltranspeptidase/glutathione hydrolase
MVANQCKGGLKVGYRFGNDVCFCYNPTMTPVNFTSRRSPVYSRRGIVATSQPLATAAGIEVLSKGGNAADAAVAAAAALNVTEPTSTGIGGDMFALYFDSQTQTSDCLNGSGRAPSALTLERLKREGLLADSLPPIIHIR